MTCWFRISKTSQPRIIITISRHDLLARIMIHLTRKIYDQREAIYTSGGNIKRLLSPLLGSIENFRHIAKF